MISNQILQNTIEGLKGIARVELCVMDVDGKEVAATMDMGNCSKPAVEFAASPADSQEIQGYQYFKIYDEQQLEYILVAGGTGEDVYMIGKMVAFQIQNLLVAYKERFDKDNFIKNLLLDNLLLVDIYSRSKKLHIQTDVPRVVMIVESRPGDRQNTFRFQQQGFHHGGGREQRDRGEGVLRDRYRKRDREGSQSAGDHSSEGRHPGGPDRIRNYRA